MNRVARLCPTLAITAALLGSGRLAAQDTVNVDVRRALATRAELEAGLAQLEQVIGSPGFSKSYRQAREKEAAMVRQRLAEGDFQVGDQVDVMVVGEQSLSNKFTVLSDRTLSLPQLPPISLQGVLRSEIRDHLTREISKYIKNPQVTIQGSAIRLAILGSVGRPGYYTMPADELVSSAIMQAGGPAPGVKMEKSSVRRQGKEVIAGTEIQSAISGGQSLDQLNLHGGDELVIGQPRGGGGVSGGSLRNWLFPVQILLSISVLATRIF
jgi:protein involved in polysaccharide export with SLBB domain